jgi:hypothetical protein
MAKSRIDGHSEANGSPAEVPEDHGKTAADDSLGEPHGERDEVIATAAAIGVVGVGVLVFEAALLPAMLLGAAAALAPKYLPKVGDALNPLFKSTVRGCVKVGEKAREMTAELQEQVHDIVAEVKSESDATKREADEGPARAA